MRSVNRTGRILIALFGAGLLAAAGWDLMLASFHFDLREGYALEQGMLTGHPHWRFFQNRMLAPIIFGVIRHATGWRTPGAYQATFILLLSCFYLTLGGCLWNLTKRPGTVTFGLLAAFALNAILMRPPWFYLWDLIDLSIFTLLAWALLSSQRLWVLTLIIAAEIFNREIAVILAGLLVIDALLRRNSLGAQQAWRQTILGVALAIIGVIIIEGLRRALLIAEVGPARWPWVKSGPFFHFQIFINMRNLFGYKPRRLTNMLPQYGTVLAFAVWLIYQAMRGISGKRRAALWFATLFVAVFIFGYAEEWRVWLIFVPYLILTLAMPPVTAAEWRAQSAAPLSADA